MNNNIKIDVDPEIHEEAINILKEGNPLEYIVKAVGKRHKGDINQIKILALSYPALLAGTVGHRFISGDSESGKSNIAREVGKTLPDEIFVDLAGSSPKSKFYLIRKDPHALEDKVLLYDDTKIDDAEFRRLIRILKDLRPGEEKIYETIIERKPERLPIRGNCVIWETAVSKPSDKQDYSRGICITPDDNPAHRLSVEKEIRRLEGKNHKRLMPEEYPICKEIAQIIREVKREGVIVPYFERIEGVHGYRSNDYFMSLIKGHAMLFYFQREKNEEGKVITIEKDFEFAKNVWIATIGERRLTDQQKSVYNNLPIYADANKTQIDNEKIRLLFGVSESRASQILNKMEEGGLAGFIRDYPNYRRKFWYKKKIEVDKPRLLEPGESEDDGLWEL